MQCTEAGFLEPLVSLDWQAGEKYTTSRLNFKSKLSAQAETLLALIIM